MALNLTALKEQLVKKGYDEAKVSKFISYLLSDLDKTGSVVTRHTEAELANLFVRYYNAGTNIDGINVILSGRNMGLITFHGYMNKVKASHPGVFFDVQIVRKGDEFKFAKESGSVVYSHEFTNPFGDTEIIGAYCVVTLEDGNQSIELLNQRDYEEMKNSSRNQTTWKKWPTEFWRKSVIKRACKIYFSEELEKLEEIDNEDYGISELEKEKATDKQKDAILKAHAKKA